MIQYSFQTPYSKYDIMLIQIEDKGDCEELKKFLKRKRIVFGEDSNIIDDILYKINNGYVDGGETNWNASIKKVLCIFYEYSTEEIREEVYEHEKRHVEDRILKHLGIDDIESNAYFAGFLGRHFYKFRCMLKK